MPRRKPFALDVSPAQSRHLLRVGSVVLLLLSTGLAGCLGESNQPMVDEPLDCGKWQDAREILTTRSHEAFKASEETPEDIIMWRWGLRGHDRPGERPESTIAWSMFPEEDIPPLVFDLRCAMKLRESTGDLAQPTLRLLSSPSAATKAFAALQAEQERQGGSCTNPCWIETLGSLYRVGHGDSRVVASLGETASECAWPNGWPMASYYGSYANQGSYANPDPEDFDAVSFEGRIWEDDRAAHPEHYIDYERFSEAHWPRLLSDVLCIAEWRQFSSTPAQRGMADEVMDLLFMLWDREAPSDSECCIIQYENQYFRVGYGEYHISR